MTIVEIELYDYVMQPITPTVIQLKRGTITFDVTTEQRARQFGHTSDSADFNAYFVIEDNKLKVKYLVSTSNKTISEVNTFEFTMLTTTDSEFTKFKFI